jgi:tetratricopeptide (TPR) repeat protein
MGKTNDLLGRILTHGPSQNTIFLALTEMTEEGRYSEVIQECLKALRVYPDDIRLRNLLAKSYVEAGFISLAEAELAKVTSELETLSSAYKLQARIYRQQEKIEDASVSLKRYLALNPDDEEAINLFAKILSAETMAEPEFKPFDSEAAKETVEEEFFEGEVDATVGEEEEKIVDLATPTLAELYFSQGQTREAIETYEKVLLNDPNDKKSEQRFNELKASHEKNTALQPSVKDTARAKTEKSIEILEDWLSRIQGNC